MTRLNVSIVGAAAVAAVLAPVLACADSSVPGGELALAGTRWEIVDRESGPVNYYALIPDSQRPFIRGAYRPGMETVVLGFRAAAEDRRAARKLRWSWRAVVLPKDGNPCVPGRGDSPAAVYVTWKRGLRWYTLKYVWSADVVPGTTCSRKRNPFVAQDTIVLGSGPVMIWRTEEVDLQAEFRKHFENGNLDAQVPDLAGIGIMTDGDQTRSPSAGDYADFMLIK